jgi:shikimate kinase/3-dehydroquinate synthase
MGTGKTVAGRLAAEALRLPFFDLDEVIEARANMPVAEIFAQAGEPEFRRMERRAVLDAARLSGAAVATGGGAVLDGESFGALAEGAVVSLLAARPEEVVRRVGESGERPLLVPDAPGRTRELLEARAPAYAAAGEALDTTELTPGEVAAEIAARYRAVAGSGEAARIPVEGPDGPYPVVIGTGAVDRLGEELAEALPGLRGVAVAADETVDRGAGERVSVALQRAGIRVAARIALPAGEAAKSVEVEAALWSQFRDAGLERSDAVVAVGGGAALDAAGFAAATYARGLALVNVPTTLLAMVDAALGGKVGIDHAGVKNLVGVFHHPRLVVTDPSTLASLSPRALRAGLAEVVKALLLASPLALDRLSSLEVAPTHADGTPRHLVWAVEQAVRVKAAYVADDPRDRGVRQALNLGHTFAHAIEAATDCAVPHGEAVAIGLMAASRLGAAAGVTPPETPELLLSVLTKLGLPTEPPAALNRERLLTAMLSDKKRRSGRAVFVVPAPGGAAGLEGVEPEQALALLLPGRTLRP